MPYILGDLLRFEDVQTMVSVTIRNAYFYEISELTGTVVESEILQAFVDGIIAPVTGIQHTSLEHTLAKLDNITDGLSFAETDLTGFEGVVMDAALPTYSAYSFKLLRGSKVTRNGFKRIAGPTEESVATNFLTSAFRDGVAAQAVIAAMASTLTVTGVDGTATLLPVIAGRPIAPSTSYRTQPVLGVQLQNAISTQVSRKAGRGE